MSGVRKGVNQKLKMLYLARIFMEETDDENALTMAEIIDKLEAYGVNADRKTLYQDFDELRHYGLDIVVVQEGRNFSYHIGEREFELAELKLLVDSVQAAKFITDRKSKELIGKLESLVSRHQARKLHREVIISGRVKAMNESIYYNVDALHEAIGAGRQIKFKYFNWNIRKEPELRRGGDWYRVSPWALLWEDENYYLVAYDPVREDIVHYRVDKMQRITLLDEPREGREEFSDFDVPHYSKTLFGMYGGEETKVTIEAANHMVGIMIDRFGKDIIIVPKGSDRFSTTVSVAVSTHFFGWIISLGEDVRITGPEWVADGMRSEIARLSRQYGAIE